jgi:3-dehydroquinate synthase
VQKLWIDLDKDRSCQIIIGAGILGESTGLLSEYIGTHKTMVVSNPLVNALYGQEIAGALNSADIKYSVFLVPDGEEYKNLEQASRIIDQALNTGMQRDDFIIALGGGVIGDIAGFAASVYQRGIPCIQIPTTLLSQVDSSVGGKTAVNHPKGKNMIGTFHQPVLVIIDTLTLSTLAEREYLAGLGEVVKYGIIYDHDFFSFLENNAEKVKQKEPDTIQEMICRCIKIKSRIVSQDEKEAGLRMVLNLGHTFGHALEKLGNYKEIKHGEAVVMGIILASRLALEMGLLDNNSLQRIITLFAKLGIVMQWPDFSAIEVYNCMLNDKKVRDQQLQLVVPKGIGDFQIITGVEKKCLIKIIKECINGDA